MPTGWVWRTSVLVRQTRRPEQQASDLVMLIEVGLRVELCYHSREQCYSENIVILTGRAGGALLEDLKESQANHEVEGYPQTGGTEGDSISECFVSLPATKYLLRLYIEEWSWTYPFWSVVLVQHHCTQEHSLCWVETPRAISPNLPGAFL